MTTVIDPAPPRRRRLLSLVTVAAAALGMIGFLAGPASAQQNCRTDGNASICLAIDGVGGGRYAVHVGIDVHIPLAEAQEYIDDTGDPFIVSVRGDDGGSINQFLFSLPLTDIGATTQYGLSADFDLVVPGSWLNEDNPGTDEIKAQVELIDTDVNQVRATYVSPKIEGNFF